MLAPGIGQCVEGAISRQDRHADAFQLGVEKAHVKFGIVDDQPRVAEEGEHVGGDVAKQWLAPEKLAGETVNAERFLGDIPLRIKIDVKMLAGRNVIQDLDAGDFNEAVACVGIKSRRFGVQNDFAHALQPVAERPRPAGSRPRHAPQLPGRGWCR